MNKQQFIAIDDSQIAAHDQYLNSLDAIWKGTFGNAQHALTDILTADQLNLPVQKLSDEEKWQADYIGNLFLWDANQSFIVLEDILSKNINSINIPIAIKAYDKLALNQKIGIKNTIMRFKGDSGIQRTLINAWESLKKINEFITILERIWWENSDEIVGDEAAIKWAEEVSVTTPQITWETIYHKGGWRTTLFHW